MADIAAIRIANTKRWSDVRPVVSFVAVARALVAPPAKSRYQSVQTRTGVPWYFIAIVHEREASQSWAGSLAQGDPWNKVSVHVPAGRGPFGSWEDAAVDALINCAPFAAHNKDWSIGGLLTECEQYNGLGYAARGVPSPYVWAGTNQYSCGKFVKDGVYNPDVVDRQLGCAGLLLAMMALDSSIKTGGPAPIASPAVAPPASVAPSPQPSAPSLTNPAKGSIGASIAALFSAIFKRKAS